MKAMTFKALHNAWERLRKPDPIEGEAEELQALRKVCSESEPTGDTVIVTNKMAELCGHFVDEAKSTKPAADVAAPKPTKPA